MELILKSNNENSIAKIIALAKKLNVSVEQRDKAATDSKGREELLNSIMNFKASSPSSFGDASEWQRNTRKDNELPFSSL